MHRPPRPARIDIDALVSGAYGARDADEVHEWLDRLAQAAAELTDDHARARLLLVRAVLAAPAGDPRLVRADAEEALARFEAVGDLGRLAHAAAVAGTVARQLDDVNGSLDHMVRALVALERVHDDEVIADVLHELAVSCFHLFAYDRALELYERSGAAARRLRSRWRVERSQHDMAETLVASVRLARIVGEKVDDEARLLRAESLARELTSAADTDEYLLAGPRLVADVLCEQGRPEEAWLTLIAAPPAADEYPSSVRLAAEARCLRLLGQPLRALVGLDEALALVAHRPDDPEALFLLDERSLTREACNDLSGALDDARAAAALVWRRHQRQMGRVVDDVWLDVEREVEALHVTRSAETDPLTDVGNRQALERRLDRSGDRAVLAVLAVDLDHLGAVNEAFGPAVGDEVLAAVAGLLRLELRDSDLVARQGGDDFVLVLDGLDLEAAQVIAERVRRRVAGHDWTPWGEGLRMTVSIGAAAGPGRDARRLVQRADLSLFEAKRAGRDRVAATG